MTTKRHGRFEASSDHDRHARHGGSNLDTVILFPGALGDLVLALPALRALHGRHADGRVTLALNGWLVPVARLAGLGDAHVDLDAAATVGLFGGDTVPSWAAGRPRMYSWLGAADPAVRARLASLASTITFARVVRDDGPGHASAAYAAQVGVEVDDAALDAGPRIDAPPPPAAAGFFRGVRCPRLVIHAGAGGRRKCWDPAAFAAIAGRWRRRGGGVLELAGPAEPAAGLVAGAVVATPSLVELAGILAASDAYLGNDSGVSHLAGAVGARGVAVFGATSPARWRPLAPGIVPVDGGMPGDAGIAAGDGDVARVWEALATAADLDNAGDGT